MENIIHDLMKGQVRNVWVFFSQKWLPQAFYNLLYLSLWVSRGYGLLIRTNCMNGEHHSWPKKRRCRSENCILLVVLTLYKTIFQLLVGGWFLFKVVDLYELYEWRTTYRTKKHFSLINGNFKYPNTSVQQPCCVLDLSAVLNNMCPSRVFFPTVKCVFGGRQSSSGATQIRVTICTIGSKKWMWYISVKQHEVILDKSASRFICEGPQSTRMTRSKMRCSFTSCTTRTSCTT